jgi:hypothetical protein
MRVKWIEQISAYRAELIYDMYPEANACDFDKHYEGDIIGTNRNIFGTSFLIIACTDGKIRECEITNAKIIQS